jgi:hypothetical protein
LPPLIIMGNYRMTGRGGDIKGGRDIGMGGEFVEAGGGRGSEKRIEELQFIVVFPLPLPKYKEHEFETFKEPRNRFARLHGLADDSWAP